MKRLIALLATVAALATAGTAAAGIGGNVVATNLLGQCVSGTLVVNVNYTLTNDYDSGFGGNAWANDTIDRHLQVWQTAPGTFCATIEDHGTFSTFAGTSPSGTSTVSAGVTGAIIGGYVTKPFTGTFAPGSYATRGNLGTFDLQCDASFNCTGAHPSFLSYFSSAPAWDYAFWGWVYRAGSHGTWLNASTGSSGDITG